MRRGRFFTSNPQSPIPPMIFPNQANVPHATLAHVVPVWLLVGVFAVLILLTGLTLAATWLDMGALNLLVALVIATIKAALVALYFMHLRYDHPFNAFVFVVALVFLGLFVGITLMDVRLYQPEIQQYEQSGKG